MTCLDLFFFILKPVLLVSFLSVFFGQFVDLFIVFLDDAKFSPKRRGKGNFDRQVAVGGKGKFSFDFVT